MAGPLIHEDFLLQTKTARELFHGYAEKVPIIDYHCHIPPKQIAEDTRWENMTQIWLYGDHYKWRAMRGCGVPERFITGDASDWEKFQKWAETVPATLRNPLYHWTHLELNRPFGISDRLLNPETAKGIYDECNAKLAQPEFSCRGIIKQMNVACICTTDDPIDTLEYHQRISEDASFGVPVLPAWRPDKGMAVENPKAFNDWVNKLAAAADVDINNFAAFMEALRKRHDFFHSMGCRVSDHGIETAYAADYSDEEIAEIFDIVRSGKTLRPAEIIKFKSAMLYEFGLMDAEKGWAQQFHFGALRNVNSKMFDILGPDTGYDAIADVELARPLAKLLDRLNSQDKLAKTILYNLNPRDNELLVSIATSFGGGVPGKMQFGSGWWFLDQKDGMEKQMTALSSLGLLSRFVGMLTDSRSFLSYVRHEYFRRILCNLLGNDIENGLIPNDIPLVGKMVKDISYNNAAKYFGFDLKVKEY